MATKAQIHANRQNAQKSTGPKTAEGKAVVSQNAVKHGLFAHEAVIHGENADEFELYRGAFLAELRPVGAVEAMLAERIVSLSWRLQRAERLQNQAIDARILQSSGGRLAKATRSLLPGSVRQKLADSGVMEPDPSLGRIFAKDSLDAWFLDRLLLYERRIETSMFRTIEQLRQFQRRRETRQAHAPEGQATKDNQRQQKRKGDLKKQSQFAQAIIGAKACVERDWDDLPGGGDCEDKANQSQLEGRPEDTNAREGSGRALRGAG